MESTAIIYREWPARSPGRSATVIALHDEGGDLDSVGSLRDAFAASFDVVALQAWRPVNVRAVSAEDYQGYAWYMDHGPQRPEPATFGDSLWQIEQFIGDVSERSIARPLVLFGVGQGAVLALTLAMVLPDMLDGVVAVNGYVPVVRGWEPPERPMRGLPVLALTYGEKVPSDSLGRSVDELRSRGGAVTTRQLGTHRAMEVEATGAMNAWMASYDVSMDPERVITLTGQPHHLNPGVLDI